MDLLVPLYSLPSSTSLLEKLRTEHNIIIRHAHTFEKSALRAFIEKHFSKGWADEVDAGYRHMPPSILVAVHNQKFIGFAAIDCTRKAFFGPTGVDESFRNKGVGKALLLAALESLFHMGYAYAIIGSAGPTDFYIKTVHAIPIPNSTPGIYTDTISQ